MKKQNLLVRLLAGLGWLILFYFATNIIIGGIVGGIAGAGTSSYEVGKLAGSKASLNFFQQYGLFVLIGQVISFSGLAYFGLLPGTTKYKNGKKS